MLASPPGRNNTINIGLIGGEGRAVATAHSLLARGGTTILIQVPANSKWVSNDG